MSSFSLKSLHTVNQILTEEHGMKSHAVSFESDPQNVIYSCDHIVIDTLRKNFTYRIIPIKYFVDRNLVDRIAENSLHIHIANNLAELFRSHYESVYIDPSKDSIVFQQKVFVIDDKDGEELFDIMDCSTFEIVSDGSRELIEDNGIRLKYLAGHGILDTSKHFKKVFPIKDGAIAFDKIVANTITTDQIAAGTITTKKIGSDALSALSATLGEYTPLKYHDDHFETS